MQKGTCRPVVTLWPPAMLSRTIAEVVEGDVRKVRTTGAIAHRPNPGYGGLQAFIDFHIAAISRFDAGHPDRCYPCLASVQSRPGGGCLRELIPRHHGHRAVHLLARLALHSRDMRSRHDIDALILA